jgi:thiamine biosynthesis lipoprotein
VTNSSMTYPGLKPVGRLLWVLAALTAIGACERHDVLVLQGPTMGTAYTVKVPPQSEQREHEIKTAIDAALEQLSQQMSTYIPDSEISQFNQSKDSGWMSVSAATAEVVAAAQKVSGISGGAFDVTVGPLVNLWGFGPDQRPPRAPIDDSIAALRERMGYALLEVRLNPPALRKANPELYVDLSGIAKGYGVDVVARTLEEFGIRDYLVEIGGELRAAGRKPSGEPWRIGIERPEPGGRSVQRIIELHDTALATSGDYRNFFEQDGKRYSHTIDPATGRPIEHDLASVTVVHDSTMFADAMATAMMVLGPEAGYQLAEREGLAVLFLVKAEGEFEQKATSRFKALFGE